jgi:hypothetical protein
MKKTLLIIFLSAISFAASAQAFNEGLRIGGGLSFGIPVLNLKGYSVGAGVDVLAQYALAETVGITADFGYMTLFAKDDNLASFDVLPLRIGIRYFPVKQLYGAAKFGTGIIIGKGSTGSTAYAFGAGYVLGSRMDVSAHFEGYSRKELLSPSYLSLRLGYFFK